jgi:hypothetical protein
MAASAVLAVVVVFIYELTRSRLGLPRSPRRT